MKLCALQHQRGTRDLLRLSSPEHEVRWLDPEELANATEPAVTVGTWLLESPDQARSILRERTKRQRITLIVPRLPSIDFGVCFSAPAAIKLERRSFTQVLLEAGHKFAVSGQTSISSPLVQGRWGVCESGHVVVLASRPNKNAGWLILSTASLCSRTIGVKEDVQKSLLEALITKASKDCQDQGAVMLNAKESTGAQDIDGLLAAKGDDVVPVLLALLAANGARDDLSLRAAASALGLTLSDGIQPSAIPTFEPADLRKALARNGWGTYVRRIDQLKTQA
jgi:hypothetical protein